MAGKSTSTASTAASKSSGSTKRPGRSDNRAAGKAGKAATLAEHAPPARLLAQRGLYAGPSATVSKDLYGELRTGSATRERNSVTLEPSTFVSGNTYFGRFPASYWQRWTTVSTVRLEATVSGAGTLLLGASDYDGGQRVVAAHNAADADEETVALDAAINKFLDGGALWLDLETEAGQRLTVHSVRWTVEPPERLRPTAVTICTMNRADDCLTNLRVLAGDLTSLETLDAIYVVDQGTDTVASREGYAEVAKKLDDTLHYIQQPNLGGAGGFTRGLYEVAANTATEHANVLFMDDDVLLEPDIVVRLTAFANRAADPLIVGGQMLNLLHPNQIHRGTEYANVNKLQVGEAVPHSLSTADLLGVDSETGRPNRQERRVDADYNAWWSCLIPYEVVAEIGYPMPYFFQWDDTEYGYRAAAHGFRTVTLPGAGVWHADFDWKDADEWHRYFNWRNGLITAALHSPFDLNVVTRVILAHTVRYLLGMQYGLTATIIKAIEDFLEGPEILADGGMEAMHAIKEMRSRYPETKRHPATEVPGVASNDIHIVEMAARPARQRLFLLNRILDRVRGRHRHTMGAVALDDSRWWHMALFETAVVTDASQEGVRVRRYDRQQMFELGKQLFRALRRLRTESPAVRQRYQRAVPELTSRENWTRLYER